MPIWVSFERRLLPGEQPEREACRDEEQFVPYGLLHERLILSKELMPSAFDE